SKKLMTAVRDGATRGAATRLCELGEEDDVLALTEGIETALAVQQATGTPTWSCISSTGLTAVEVPPSVRQVLIWGDNDQSGVGQKAADELALRLHREGREVRVLIPQR